MTRWIRLYLCCLAGVGFLLCLQVAPASGEVTVRAGVNRDTVTVGDPITFRVRVRRGKEDAVALSVKGDALGPFEVRESRPPSMRERDDGTIEETQDLVIAAYQTGIFEVPPVTLRFRTAAGDTGSLRSDSIPIVVRSVKPEDATDIRDVKVPVTVAPRMPVWLWVVAGLLALALTAAVWYLRHRRRRPREAPPAPPIDWFAEVAKIARMGLLEKGDYKRYYTLLSEAFRRYLEARTGVEAMECTTFEIARDLRRIAIQDQKVLDTEGFLAEADLVKFAKHSPPHQAALRAADRVRELMEKMNTEPVVREISGEDGREALPAGDVQ